MRRSPRKVSSLYLQEMAYGIYTSDEYKDIFPYNILVVLSGYREEFPWLYDAGSDLVRIIGGNTSKKTKIDAAIKFRNVLEFTCGHPVMRETFRSRKEYMMLREMLMVMSKEIERFIEGDVLIE